MKVSHKTIAILLGFVFKLFLMTGFCKFSKNFLLKMLKKYGVFIINAYRRFHIFFDSSKHAIYIYKKQNNTSNSITAEPHENQMRATQNNKQNLINLHSNLEDIVRPKCLDVCMTRSEQIAAADTIRNKLQKSFTTQQLQRWLRINSIAN